MSEPLATLGHLVCRVKQMLLVVGVSKPRFTSFAVFWEELTDLCRCSEPSMSCKQISLSSSIQSSVGHRSSVLTSQLLPDETLTASLWPTVHSPGGLSATPVLSPAPECQHLEFSLKPMISAYQSRSVSGYLENGVIIFNV